MSDRVDRIRERIEAVREELAELIAGVSGASGMLNVDNESSAARLHEVAQRSVPLPTRLMALFEEVRAFGALRYRAVKFLEKLGIEQSDTHDYRTKLAETIEELARGR